MEIEIKVDNSQKVLKALQDQIYKGLEECGMYAESRAKDNITRVKAKDTGALQNSITHKTQAVNGGAETTIGTNMHYAPYIELGTGQYVAGGRKTPWVYKDAKGQWHKTSGMEARPYLKPALTDNIDKYKNIIETNLKQ